MFDKVTNIVSKRASVEAVIHEHRAPTDVSVKLLKEMEQAAKDKLVASFILDGNSLNGVVNIYQEMAYDRLVIEVTFDLNDKRINEIIHIHRDETDIIETVKSAVANRIAVELLVNTFNKLDDYTNRLLTKNSY
jgi:hypothetical protein